MRPIPLSPVPWQRAVPNSLTSPLAEDPIIEVYKRDVDVSLLRQNLLLTPEERLQKLFDLQRFALELQQANPATARKPQ